MPATLRDHDERALFHECDDSRLGAKLISEASEHANAIAEIRLYARERDPAKVWTDCVTEHASIDVGTPQPAPRVDEDSDERFDRAVRLDGPDDRLERM